MPCRSDYPDDSSSYSSGVRDELDNVTALLCSTLTSLQFINTAALSELLRQSPALAKWWGDHQAADRKREAEEKLKRKEKDDIQKAIKKLSPRERKLLGIRG